MRLLRWLIVLVACVGPLLPPTPVAVAQTGIAVFPTKVELSGPLRGGTSIEALGLRNDADTPRTIRFLPIGEVAGWIEVRTLGTDVAVDELEMPADGEATLDLVVSVPEDVPNGVYGGALRIVSAADDDATTGVEVGVELAITVEVTGTQVIAAALSEFEVGQAEVGTPLPLTVEIRNEGNVAVEPSVRVTILDAADVEVTVVDFGSRRITPGETAVLVDAWSTTEAVAGEYSAVAGAVVEGVTLPERTVRFDLAPSGSFGRSGEVVELELSNNPEAGGVAIVNAELRNTSEVNAGTRFQGELLFEGSKVADVGSLSRDVGPGDVTTVQVFMDVPNVGVYELIGSAEVDGVLSRTQRISFEVGEPPGPPIQLYVAGGVAALLIVALIARKRRQRMAR